MSSIFLFDILTIVFEIPLKFTDYIFYPIMLGNYYIANLDDF